VEEVAMESTGIYWILIWRILEIDFKLKLVNPYFIKQVPGRKSDVEDAQWIATVLQKGLIRGSHIPDIHIRELREYERRYISLCSQVSRVECQIDNQLSRCNIRITSFASQTGSVTVKNVVRAIINGEKIAEDLEKHVHGRIRNKYKEKIRE
jgi:transposase